jgi:hypothetical protein
VSIDISRLFQAFLAAAIFVFAAALPLLSLNLRSQSKFNASRPEAA